jgi:hypothetical protein
LWFNRRYQTQPESGNCGCLRRHRSMHGFSGYPRTKPHPLPQKP